MRASRLTLELFCLVGRKVGGVVGRNALRRGMPHGTAGVAGKSGIPAAIPCVFTLLRQARDVKVGSFT